jgi:microcystin-dependent protein
MPLENANLIHQLDAANPSGADRLASGDDHIRMVKAALKATFPNIKGPMNLGHEFLNGLVAAALPVGAIMLFAGPTAPEGWVICNGQTVNSSSGGTIVTPDLRGRVPVGASAQRPFGTTWGQSDHTVTSEAGGAHSHNATIAAAGAHKHPVSLTGSTGSTEVQLNVNAPTRTVDGTGGSTAISSVAVTSPSHSHTLGFTGETGETGAHTHTATVSDHAGHGHQVKINVDQPSMALHYIIKV